MSYLGREAESIQPSVTANLPRAKRWVKVIVGVIVTSVAIVIAICSFNVIKAESKQLRVSSITPIKPRNGFEERLAKALQFKTFATEPESPNDRSPFVAFRGFLREAYPQVHQHLESEVVGGHSLLFRWKGTNPSVEPVLLMSHLDVVPVESGTINLWTHPPFDGRVADGFIWGRGALDVKCGVMGLLEASEQLLGKGFRPSGDVYFAFGHDEETGGGEGNRSIAEHLRVRGIRFRFVLDEGGSLTEGIIDGIKGPVAFVGIAEKGFATVKLKALTDGGHSSMPPPHTAVGIVAAVVSHLESNPFPTRIDGATNAMLDFLGPEMPITRRAVLANRWLTGKLITSQFSVKPSLNAQIRTTMAATVIRGGVKDNVIPKNAEALVNLRLLQGDTCESALLRIQHLAKSLGYDEKTLTCSLENHHSEPSPVSSTDSSGFRVLQKTIAEVYPGSIVAPGLSMVATDSRHFAPIATDIYRFLPFRVTNDDLKRIHGVDERIGIKTYEEMIGFLGRLIENLSLPAPSDGG